jgi:isopentenyl-diphosphate delta-isomerase
VTSREEQLVELVDEYGTAVGETSVRLAHEPPGRLHRAFSVFLTDGAGRILLQRRAAVKTRFPLRWANSCCGHPGPEEPLAEAANRRLGEELGVPAVALTECGVHLYRADDPDTGRVEVEYDHVLRGALPAGVEVRPDPDEVAEVRWVDPAEAAADLVARPEAYAPWLVGVLDRLLRPTPAGSVAMAGGGSEPPGPVRTGEVAERSGDQ